jgi:hypothetical protein
MTSRDSQNTAQRPQRSRTNVHVRHSITIEYELDAPSIAAAHAFRMSLEERFISVTREEARQHRHRVRVLRILS